MFAANGGAAPSDKVYVEDVFNTYIYNGTSSNQTIGNGIALASTSQIQITTPQSPAAYVYGITVDSSGNYYYQNNLSGQSAGMMTKLDSNRNVVWQRSFDLGTGRPSTIYESKVGSDGSIYLAGYNNSGTGYQLGLLMKYTSSGAISWAKTFTSVSAHCEIEKLHLDASDNVYVCGRSSSDSGATWYGHVSKFNSSGTLLWSQKISAGFTAWGLYKDSSNNLYGCGYTSGNVALIYKFDSNGNLLWQRQSTTANTYLFNITGDSSGNVYAVGYNNAGTSYIVKYNSTGTFQWAKTIASSDYVNKCGMTSDGNIWAASSSNVYTIDTSGNGLKKISFTIGPSCWVERPNGKMLVSGYIDSLYPAYFAEFSLDGTVNGGLSYLNISSTTFSTSAFTFAETAGSATITSFTVGTTSVTFTEAVASGLVTKNDVADVTSQGGLVWTKGRDNFSENHALVDTVRGSNKYLFSNTTDAQGTGTQLTAFTSNGYTLGAVNGWEGNWSGRTYVSWTFRKSPKFFDVVTYTGDGTSNRSIAHNLGSAPGMVIIKRTDSTGNWNVWHRSAPSVSSYMWLNTTAAAVTNSAVFWIPGDASSFYIGNSAEVNAAGGTYVAYLFAHDTTTDGLIQCGSYTGTGGSGSPVIDLGWEPQWILVKPAGTTGDWWIEDNIRGAKVGAVVNPVLKPNVPDAEYNAWYVLEPNSKGFTVQANGTAGNGSGISYIYVAIRRGPMRTPTDGTKVFQPLVRTADGATTTISSIQFSPDLVLSRNRPNSGYSRSFAIFDKLRGAQQYLQSNLDAIEGNEGTGLTAFTNTGWKMGGGGTVNDSAGSPSYIYEIFKRAPGFLDIVCWTGNGTGDKVINHNLGVVPELLICKSRSNSNPGFRWFVQSSLTGINYASLNLTDAFASAGDPVLTKTTFTAQQTLNLNFSAYTYVAYMFATCPGVSKVGTYTGTSATLNIDCGFTSGARFVMIKSIGSTGDWYIWDSARGIVSGNDPYVLLNTTAAEVSNTNYINPYSAGFTLAASSTVNVSSNTYIYLAIA